MDKVEPNQCKNMRNSDLVEDAVNDDYSSHSYKLKLSSDNPTLDQFLEEWRDELYRKNKILQLNDICLYKLFNFLPANDLCAVRETCKDFRRVSDYCIEKRSKSFRLDSNYVYGSPGEKLKEMDAIRTIRYFGQSSSTVSIVRNIFLPDEYTPRLLRVIDRYCLKLTDFTLDFFESMSPFISQRLFSNLHRLVIANCQSEPTIRVDAILQHCASLKQLKLIGWELFGNEERNLRFESLESLSLKSCVLLNSDKITDFFIQNGQLKSIAFSCCIIKTLSTSSNGDVPFPPLPPLPNLETLCFWGAVRTTTNTTPPDQSVIKSISLTSFTNLKQLTIDVGCISMYRSFVTDLAEHKSIEHLDIIMNVHTFTPELVAVLCSLKTLKILKIIRGDGLHNEIIRRLACGLPNLVEINFIHFNATFDQVENFVEFCSDNVKKIIFHRSNDIISKHPLTEKILLDIVDARLQNKKNTGTVTLFLNEMEIIKFQADGGSHLLEQHSDVIQLLPYDEKDTFDD